MFVSTSPRVLLVLFPRLAATARMQLVTQLACPVVTHHLPVEPVPQGPHVALAISGVSVTHVALWSLNMTVMVAQNITVSTRGIS